MIRKYLLRTIAALALAFAIIISTTPHAQASAPADLLVLTSFKANNTTAYAPLNAFVDVAVVPTSGTGWQSPVQDGPYNGFMLDLDGNNDPDKNDFITYTSGNLYGYATWTKQNFIWCGAAGGVPEGQMKMNLIVKATTDVGDNFVVVNGVKRWGTWGWNKWRSNANGQVSDSASGTGRSVDIFPKNPELSVVQYTFTEAAPTIPFLGKMTTTKQMANGSVSPAVAAASVKITNSINSWATANTTNPWTYSDLNVCETNKYAYNCGAAKYKNTVTVPTDYKVSSVNVTYPTPPPVALGSIPAWPAASNSFSCTGGNGTGNCSVSNLWVLWGGNYPNPTQLETNVVWNFVLTTGTTPTYKYPWLQTTQGNVVANGKISGNIASDTLVGNRATTSTTKEAEFLIISKIGGGGPFCSNKNYILTNNSATNINDSCVNGSGYSVLNVASVATGTAEDKVVAGVKAAYNALGAACKTTIGDTASPSTLSGLLNKSATDCPNGVIIKYNTGDVTLSTGFTTAKGRITFLVDGNLAISGNITYATTGYADPKDAPNLAFVVKGNIGVASGITRVDASLYATGTISTCQVPTTYICAASSSSQLVVNGFMSAQQGFRFGRVYTNSNGRPAAEVINLTLQSVVYPPPGIDYGSVFKGDSSVKIDSSEYPPRF